MTSVMSPNGTLMAYTTPIDIRDLRDQAALISMAWKDHASKLPPSTTSNPTGDKTAAPAPNLETLTIETSNNNIIVRAIQSSLLLVLVGGVPPSRKDVFKITPEARGEPRYPPVDVADDGEAVVGSGKAASVLSTMSAREKDVKGGVLHIQRKKVDALTEYLRGEFDKRGFVMPDDSSFS